jgi:hypothetical protein
MQGAQELERRLADLVAAENFAEFTALFSQDVIESSPDQRSLRLNAHYQLNFEAGHVNVPRTASGTSDWAKVSRIRITALEKING